VVLVSFGTTFNPSNSTQIALAEMIKKTPKIGFVWSLKEKYTMFDQIKAMNMPNLMLMPFVP